MPAANSGIRARPVQRESIEARHLFTWWCSRYPRWRRHLIHIPNERRDKVHQKLLAAQGVQPGASDYLIAIPRGGYPGLWLELKAAPPHGAKPSESQIEFGRAMERAGYAFTWAKGWHEASRWIDLYMALPLDQAREPWAPELERAPA